MKRLARVLVALVAALLVPGVVLAQTTEVSGIVRDSSGGVLPGVTVEASSDVLIEKVRTVITDGAGQYRLLALPPGTYNLTFTLPGFSTVVQQDLLLTGAVTATINIEMTVGALEETVTVTGQSPIVDVQSARRTQVIDGDVLATLPTSRSYNNVLQLAPGVVAGNGQAQLRPAMLLFTAHGGNAQDGRLTVDGINTGASRGGAGVSGYIPDMQNAQEVTFQISGNLGEAETGGPQMTVVPRSGGNTFSGSFFLSALNESMQGDNFDEAQLAVLAAPAPTLLLRDFQFSLGGPILQDRLWFFGNYRGIDAADAIPGMFANRNAGDPNSWRYEPDFSQQSRLDNRRRIYALRLTWQATPRNKFSGFWDEQPQCTGAAYTGDDTCHSQEEGWVFGGTQTNGFFGPGPNAPETGDYQDTYQRVQQVKYTSTVTNSLLLEAGFGTYQSQWGYEERPGNPTGPLVRVQEQQAQIFDRNGNRVNAPCEGCVTIGGNLKYRSSNYPTGYINANTWNASASYVTGSHSMKLGYQGAYHIDDDNLFNIISNDQRMTYRFNNGVPNQVTIQAGPWQRHVRTEYAAFYAQDQWTMDQLTLQGALRYDRAWSKFPEQTVGPDVWIPNQIALPATKGVNAYNDISVRVGTAYDLFGDGRTSVKFNIGKYMHPASNGGRYTASNPSEGLVTIVNRQWTDGNGNYIPDCNLLDGAAQDNRPAGGDFCGVWSDPNFGATRPTTTLSPDLLSGWGVRPHDWQIGLSVQHEIVPRVSAEVGYYRRWWPIWDGYDVTDNILVAPSDYTEYGVTAPLDPRLPGGGGNFIGGLYDINPDATGRAENIQVSGNSIGDYSRYWDGFDITAQARLANGLTIQGGSSTGRLVEDVCEVRAGAPEFRTTNPYCRTVEPLRTQLRALASYLVPKIDVQLSGTYSSLPGTNLSANVVFTNADVIPSLGRPLSQGAVVVVNVLEPETMYGDRINQLDMRIGKLIRIGGTRTNISLDIVNLLNANPNLAYSGTFGASWPAPTQVLVARLFRISGQFDF